DEEPSGDLVVGHETRQVETGIALLVECPAELETVGQHGPYTPAAVIDSELPEVPEPRRRAVDERVAHRSRGDPHDLTGRSIARDERLVHIAKGRGGERRIRFPF